MNADTWAHLHFAAQLDLLRYFATSPLADVGSGRVAWVITGVFSNTHNGVTGARLTADGAAAAIGEAVARFQAREVPAIWFIDDDSTPSDLGPQVEAAGGRPERSGWVMGAELARLPAGAAPLPGGVTVSEVTGARQLDAWLHAAAGVTFDDDRTSSHNRRRLYASLGLGADRPWRHWLATDDEIPVGTASALFTDDIAALDHVGVAPTHRRRGIGTALTLASIAAARAAGLRFAVLGPSPDGQPLYEALGFELTPALTDREYYLPLPPPDR